MQTGVSLAATAATSASLTDDINKVSERTDKAALVASTATTNLKTTCAKVSFEQCSRTSSGVKKGFQVSGTKLYFQHQQ